MRGQPPVVELVDRAQWVGMPSIVLGELHSGFLAGSNTERNTELLERFLSHPVVEEVIVDHTVARIYAEMVLALRRQGTPVPTNDIWVAAAAVRAGATLVAYDAHFSEIQRVGLLLLDHGGA